MTTQSRTATKSRRPAAATGRNSAAEKNEAAAPQTDTKLTKHEATIEVKATNINGEESLTDSVIEAREFATTPAFVEVKHCASRQPVQFESVRVEVRVSVPCYAEEVPSVLQQVAELAATTCYAELDALGLGASTDTAAPQEEQEQEGYTYDDLVELDLPGLKAVAKEVEYKIPTGKAKDADAIFAGLLDHLGIEEPAAEEEEGEDGITADELANMDDAELKALCKENKVKNYTKMDGNAMYEALYALFGFSEEEEEEQHDDPDAAGGEDPTADELAEMEDQDLIAVAEEFGIEVEGLEGDELYGAVMDFFGYEVAPTEEEINGMDLAQLQELVDSYADTENPITISARAKKNVTLMRKEVIKGIYGEE